METRKCYYIAGGRTLAAIKAYMEAYRPYIDYMSALREELGSPSMYGYETRVRGFRVPPTGIPAGWRKDGADGMIPRADKSGKVWRDRMDAAPPIITRGQVLESAGMQRTNQFIQGYFVEAKLAWEVYGDAVVAATYQLADGSSLGGDPLDCERIPDSRYWKIKEDAAV